MRVSRFEILQGAVLAFLMLVLCVGVAQAEDDEADEDTLSVRERIEAFSADFDEGSKAHFQAIAGSHNLIEVVKMVQGDVENAIERCSENNPDMEDALETRYDEWEDAIEPIIEEAEANVDNMISVQDYAKSRDIRKILDFMDETREEKTSDVDKIPVTTPEACEYLRNKMDETEDNLTQLLRSTLVSLPQQVKEEDDARKAEEAAEAEAAAEEAEQLGEQEDAE